MTGHPRFRDEVIAQIEHLHDRTTELFTDLDQGGEFQEDRWQRAGGGGGVSRTLYDGATFEKAGVNRSAVEGLLVPQLAHRIGAQVSGLEPASFFVTGLSLVVHPRSPMVPTVHLNVRYFEIMGASGQTLDAWFGGGTDLTPTYPYPDDATHFHRSLKAVCDRHHADFYPRFKTWCDHYFVNTHRGDERRGIGGIFFDNLRDGEAGLCRKRLLGFLSDVGGVLPEAYRPIVERRRGTSYGERERRLQLTRRGRYVEFNLVHDRGTLFGLQTGARIESVLMSLPPLAAWEPGPTYQPGSFEARLIEMLEPRDWVAGEEPAVKLTSEGSRSAR
jgi:coproporphyrinogen III oxidase